MKIFVITNNSQVLCSFESIELANQYLNNTTLQLCKEGFMIVSFSEKNFTLSKGGQQVIIKLQESDLQTTPSNSISKLFQKLL